MNEYYFLINRNNRWITDFFTIRDGNLNSLGNPIDSRFALSKANLSDIWEVVYENWGDRHSLSPGYDVLEKCTMIPGMYHKRIYRPIFQSAYISAIEIPEYSRLPVNYHMKMESLNQLTTLVDRLTTISKTIHLHEDNFSTYGNEIRNLLILACTEVEAQLRGILDANSTKQPDHYSTKEYIKLLPFLRLKEYEVALTYYPWLQSRSPFKKWNNINKQSTKSLPWYDAYNAVKHNREGDFPKARLEHVLDAVIACAILWVAQYSIKPQSLWKDRLGHFFYFYNSPKWDGLDHYIHPLVSPDDGGKWEAVTVL